MPLANLASREGSTRLAVVEMSFGYKHGTLNAEGATLEEVSTLFVRDSKPRSPVDGFHDLLLVSG